MRITREPALLALAIWLIFSGLVALLGLSFAGLGTVMAILAIIAGALLLLGGVRLASRSLAAILLAAYLLLLGLLALVDLGFAGSEIVLAVLALAAGVALLLGR